MADDKGANVSAKAGKSKADAQSKRRKADPSASSSSPKKSKATATFTTAATSAAGKTARGMAAARRQTQKPLPVHPPPRTASIHAKADANPQITTANGRTKARPNGLTAQASKSRTHGSTANKASPRNSKAGKKVSDKKSAGKQPAATGRRQGSTTNKDTKVTKDAKAPIEGGNGLIDPASKNEPSDVLLNGSANAHVAAAAVLPEPPKHAKRSRRLNALSHVEVPVLHKGADVSKLPPALRCLASFNQGGYQEIEQVETPSADTAAASTTERKDGAGPAVVTDPPAAVRSRRRLQNGAHPPPPNYVKESANTETDPTASMATPTAPRTTSASPTHTAGPTVPTNATDAFSQLVSNTERSKLPACLRALMDHNPKGYEELGPTRGVRIAKVKSKAALDAVAKPKEPARPPAHHNFPLDDVRRWVFPGPLKNTPMAKVWVMMNNVTHRRFKSSLGSFYEYKQCVSRPCLFRGEKGAKGDLLGLLN